MNPLKFFYHGRDRKMCYYDPHCMVCFLRTLAGIITLRKRVETRERPELPKNVRVIIVNPKTLKTTVITATREEKEEDEGRS